MAARCSVAAVAPRRPLLLLVPRRLARPPLLRHQSSSPSSSSSASASAAAAAAAASAAPPPPVVNGLPESRLNPRPDDYAAPAFADRAELAVSAGRGGNGCVSFLREAFLPDGPPNGGDGGAGGNVYIQAAHGETSLHKLARRRFVRAGRGRNGQGGARAGARGEDVVITVPVGTLVRELGRRDPAADDAARVRAWRAAAKEKRREVRLRAEERQLQRQPDDEESAEPRPDDDVDLQDPQRAKFLLYPGMARSDAQAVSFPPLPRRLRLHAQPPAPVALDLARPTPRPILLAAGGVGGLGNPHFTSRQHPRPLFATRGDGAVSMRIALELRLLADVGLVGPPNAGKSTLLRALTNSRTRVGAWAFTTLQPNVGTVVLDRCAGRPAVSVAAHRPAAPRAARSRFSVADIPGLVRDAHLDRGLGIAFLRHVERAAVLAFVVDLAAGCAVAALDALWREVGLYARMRDDEDRARDADAAAAAADAADPLRGPVSLDPPRPPPDDAAAAEPAPAPHIAAKPWFVVATKADLPDTQPNFARLRAYLDDISAARAPHPSRLDGAWTDDCVAIPVSAIHAQGVDRVVHWIVKLLDA